MPKAVKSMMIGAGLALTAAAAYAPSTALAGPITHIACPVAQAERQITTPIPPGWWQTPFVNTLQSTNIQPVGGKPTMICNYGYAGDIMHLVPAGMQCAAVGGGFDCQPIAPPAPPVRSSGTVNIPQTYVLDLDTGGLITSGDVWFEAVTATQFYLTPTNGGRFNVGGFAPRGYAGCSSVPMSTAKVNMAALHPGQYVCARSRTGNVAEIRIDSIWGPPSGTKTLKVTYTTWN